MKDQYGNDVPDDLVVIPDIDLLSGDEIQVVDRADWYEHKGVILVAAKAIDHLSETDPQDAGIDKLPDTIDQIDQCLHRYSDVDGFYHA